jgi:hypothetical protein
VGLEVSSAAASAGTAAVPAGLPNFATGGGGGGGAGGGAALLLEGGVVVTTVTVCDVDVRGNWGPATGEPGIAVPQPATRAASSTTACLPEGMAGTLNGLRGLGYHRFGQQDRSGRPVLDLAVLNRFRCPKRDEIKAFRRCFRPVTREPGKDPVFRG